jgi:hypothetical protein
LFDHQFASFQLPASSFQGVPRGLDGVVVASAGRMMEQPPKPDVPKVPDVVNKPGDIIPPIPEGEHEGAGRPEVQPTPPPTDPGDSII